MPDYRKGKDLKLLDIEKLKDQLDSAEVYEDENDDKLQTIYLGDIKSITPSGKIYTPWAHSNVDECPHCKGTEKIKNKHGQITKTTRMAKHVWELAGAWKRSYWELTKNQQNKIDKIRKQIEHYTVYIPCPECGGLGSLEARLDQDFWEQLESELDEIKAWYHGSDGDGCDVMVSRAAREQHD